MILFQSYHLSYRLPSSSLPNIFTDGFQVGKVHNNIFTTDNILWKQRRKHKVRRNYHNYENGNVAKDENSKNIDISRRGCLRSEAHRGLTTSIHFRFGTFTSFLNMVDGLDDESTIEKHVDLIEDNNSSSSSSSSAADKSMNGDNPAVDHASRPVKILNKNEFNSDFQTIQRHSYNDTIAINNVGQAIVENEKVLSEVEDRSILAIDPSTVEIVSTPKDDSSKLNNNLLSSFVTMFRGSANYIANHRNTVAVYHIPGKLLEWEGFSDLMDDIALTWLLGMKLVIVVGCRQQIDDRLIENSSEENAPNHGKNADPLSKGLKKHDGIRLTDIDTLRVVKEEAGYVRFEVERQLARSLRMHGVNSSTSGHQDGNVVSGNFYSAQPYGVINGIDYMYTGFPRRIEVDKIQQVLDGHDVVLLTALGASPSGEIFNVNSEFLAANTAGYLGASKVIYFTEHEFTFLSKTASNNSASSSTTTSTKLIQNLRLSDARNLLRYYNVKMHKKGFATIEDTQLSPAVTEALLKVGWATSALEQGVKRAHIIAPSNGALLQELYTRDGSGTLISRDLYEGIRNADVNDVAGIFDLIEPLILTGTLVNRPKNVLEKDVSSYYVYTRDNLIVACAQLKIFENGFAEIGCLVVSKEYRSQGRGDAMLGYLERLSVRCGCSTVFVLSTQTMEWFVERGFKEVGVNELPPSRKAVYNAERKSKIYMKTFKDDRDLDAAELW
eukprot:CAMPEP_0184867584 /NCGR_PEP_ID=MMETSP0580-20130426/27144_1 /TAXON_ID=1118495 /ORGANISM="Dactyliosolen fragilissimus" /LENGTH=723 /DNA_ID=CAMNT_0027367963 /DNA_START=105 /DNA_END=2273 /DNA_ORIENTATION=+